jgi:molecular chaperone GrpE
MSEEKNVNTEQTEVKPEKKERKNKKDEEIQKLKQELEAKQDLLLRTAAEFDNFKKRTERERISTAQYSKAMVIKEILPILDNADRALSADKDSPDFAKGVEMIVRQMSGLTEKLGVTEVAQVGDTFDPNLHEAVMHVEDENLGENVIAAVLQKGYKIGDTVIRAAMVTVAN